MLGWNKLPLDTPRQLNADLRLISSYLRDGFRLPTHPRNLGELSSLLRNKLHHSTATREDKQRCREWLATRKVQVRPLPASERRREEDGMGQLVREVVQPRLLEQQALIEKTIDYSLNSVLQYAVAGRSVRRNFMSVLMGRLKCGGGRVKEVRTAEGRAARSEEKRRKYVAVGVELVRREAEEGREFVAGQWAQALEQSVEHSIWRILSQQAGKFGGDTGREEVMGRLLANSLRALQGEFDEELPRNEDRLASYLESKYLCRMEPSSYLMDPHLGCLWGKAFLYFRAGRRKELASLLERHGLGHFSDQVERGNGWMRGSPVRVGAEAGAEKEAFRDQIVYALRGERKYSDEAISELASLDSVWILLRNTGVFYPQEREQFEELRDQLADYYQQNLPAGQTLPFLAYLLDYDSLARLGENEALDRDDYLHLLVLLHKLPFLLRHPNALDNLLAEHLLSYLLELARDQDPALEYYFALLPHNALLRDLPPLLVSNSLFPTLRWEVLKTVLDGEVFAEVLQASSERYGRDTGNFLEGAERLMRELERPRIEHVSSAVEMLFRMLVRSAASPAAYEEEEVTRAIRLIDKWITGEMELNRTYLLLLRLVEGERQLMRYLVDRNYSRIEQLLEEGHLFFSTLDYLHARMLEKLAQLGGQDLLFIYLRNAAKAADYIFARTSRGSELRSEVITVCQLVKDHPSFANPPSQQALDQLLALLQAEISFPSFPRLS